MTGIPLELLKILESAGEKGGRPFDRLAKGKPLAKGREAGTPSALAPLAQSALFLYFDCFDEAHNIAQDHEGTAGNWLHAIVHRREPDAGNAKYWYARVKIPMKVSQGIAQGALKILGKHSPKELGNFQKKLGKSGQWEPESFVDLCEKFRQGNTESPEYRALAQIQEVEWRGLLELILKIREDQ